MVTKRNIKCPICGNEEFVSIGSPYYEVLGDGRVDTSGSHYGCTKCGLVLVFDDLLVRRSLDELDRLAERERKIEAIKEEIKSLEEEKEGLPNKISCLEKEKEDPNRTVARDQELAQEIKSLKSRLSSLDSMIARKKDEMVRL